MEVRRRAQTLRMQVDLDGDHQAIERFRDAQARLEDPSSRLEEELYWFTLTPDPVPPDLDLTNWNAAIELIERLEPLARGGSADGIHDLAVLRHAAAIEARPPASGGWRPALQAWKELWGDEEFWTRIGVRAVQLGDARTGDALVQRLRKQLPSRILGATAGEISRLLELGEDAPATAGLAAVLDSGFPKADVLRARASATERLVGRLRDQLGELRKKTDGAEGAGLGTLLRAEWATLQAALAGTATRLKAADGEGPEVQAALDEVGDYLRILGVRLYNESDDFAAAIPLQETALAVAGTAYAQQGLTRDLATLRSRQAAQRASHLADAERWDEAAAAADEALRMAATDDDRAQLQSLIKVFVFNAAIGRALSLAKARRWNEAITAAQVEAWPLAVTDEQRALVSRFIAVTAASRPAPLWRRGWVWVGGIVVAVVLIGLISSAVAGPLTAGNIKVVDGTISSYGEATRGGVYDHNELKISGDTNTYTLTKDLFHPALPTQVYHDGRVRIWVREGSTEVLAIQLSDQNDTNPTKYTTDQYDKAQPSGG